MEVAQEEKHVFQADIHELLHLIIHAFYSNRDVFLREIISNASDAIDKQRILDIRHQLFDQNYYIRLKVDKESNTLFLEDNGVGMSRNDLVEHLSTIARSGTKEFVKHLQETSEQIGQFGVGFYSAFLVANQVEVYSQKQGEPYLKWSSSATDYYTISPVPESNSINEVGHGTRIVLHLKEDAREYTNESTLRQIVKAHSSFITYPIYLWCESKNHEMMDISTIDEAPVPSDEPIVEEGASDGEETEKNNWDWDRLNGDKPIWYSKPSEVQEKEYQQLYQSISQDQDNPLFYHHFETEGAYEFRGILFIPSKPPYKFEMDETPKKHRISLYVKKVLILKELELDMMPEWMSFVTGIIDSSDLPLNVSREMLQDSSVLKAMKSQLKKQVMSLLTNLLRNHKELYRTFYDTYHRHVKLGIHANDQSLLPFLLVKCNDMKAPPISLQDYVDHHMKEDQKEIYYATGQRPEKAVLVKSYRSRDYSVLYFDESMDEFMLLRMHEYQQRPMINISKEHKVPWETTGEPIETHNEFCTWAREILQDSRLMMIRISSSLIHETDPPACIMSSKFSWTANFERVMKSQPIHDANMVQMMQSQKIFELNVHHPLVIRLLQTFESNREQIVNDVRVLYQCALLSAGYTLEDMDGFVDSVLQTL